MIPSITINRLLYAKGFKKFKSGLLSEKEISKYQETLDKARKKYVVKIEKGSETKLSLRQLRIKQMQQLKLKCIESRQALLKNNDKLKPINIKTIKIKRQEIVYLKEESDKIASKILKSKEKNNNQIIKYQQQINQLIKKKETKRSVKKIIKISMKEQRTKIIIERLNIKEQLLNKNQLPRQNIIEKIKQWFSNIKYDKQKAIWGIIFSLPFILGVVIIFIPSLVQTLVWTFYDVTPSNEGYIKIFIGIQNYKYLFQDYVINGNMIFNVSILELLQKMAFDLPVIIIFSILIAILLNKPFKGHTIIKAIFFIPIIFNSALVSETLNSSFGQHLSGGGEIDESFVGQIMAFFSNIGAGQSIIGFVFEAVNRILEIINLSSIQILMFIAAIQSIPGHLYEAAKIEGATKYETFWKITIPMITPIILTAAVYTVVDSFSRSPITIFFNKALSERSYGLAATISIVYMLINLLIIGLVFMVFRKKVFYHDKEK